MSGIAMWPPPLLRYRVFAVFVILCGLAPLFLNRFNRSPELPIMVLGAWLLCLLQEGLPPEEKTESGRAAWRISPLLRSRGRTFGAAVILSGFAPVFVQHSNPAPNLLMLLMGALILYQTRNVKDA